MTTATPTAEPGPARPAGIVLAGGLSRRMGRDKTQLRWQGRTLLEHMRALLFQAGAGTVHVSGDHPGFGGIPDAVPGCGPLGGLYSVVATLADGPAWVVPVDMPQLHVGLLRQLQAAADARCVVFAGHPLPMLLQITPASRALLADMVADADGPRSLRSLQRRLEVRELPLPTGAAAALFNCNTPEQWKELVP